MVEAHIPPEGASRNLESGVAWHESPTEGVLSAMAWFLQLRLSVFQANRAKFRLLSQL